MSRSRSRSLISGLLQFCRNRRPQQPLWSPYHDAAYSQGRLNLEALRCRLLSIFSESGHVIKHPQPPISSRRPGRQQLLAPWHDDPRKVAVAMALLAAGATVAAHLRYSEKVPFTGRTHLVVLSHGEARELDEAVFAKLKKEHASEILGPGHPQTIRVRHIAREIITAAHTGLAIKWKQMGGCSMNLDWLECLDWEVIVVRGHDLVAGTRGGKIIIYTGILDNFKSDAEIAAIIAHEVAHVVARHSSEMTSNWFPLKLLLHRQETEADHIGMILFAVAGFDPRIVPLVFDKAAKMGGVSPWPRCLAYLTDEHPPTKRRSEFLSQPKVMEEALEFYSQVRPRVQPKYPKIKQYAKHKRQTTR